MAKRFRGLLIAAGIVVGLAVILGAGWLVLTRMSFPRTRGTERLSGLTAPVTIRRDVYGVPHIYARTSRDLFFAEGYVHAQDRFWQMEFSRRVGEGRLSELFGKSQLQTDIFLRTLGVERKARSEFEAADPETKSMLEAYAAGVNAYIAKRGPARLGLEFAILNLTGVKTKIEPWTPVNSLEWAKMMAFQLEGNWDGEAFMTQLMHTLGRRDLTSFFTPYRKEMPVTVSNEELGAAGWTGSHPISLLGSDRVTGSNGWVIAGSKTASGKPILANDMHLDLQVPSVWYEVGLHGVSADGRVGRTPECPYDVYGYSLPGDPGVVTGHNDRIAWGLTNLYGDNQDLYIERINPDNPDQYLADGKWRDMGILYEEIKVRKAKEPYRLRVRSTRHGPIISDHGDRSSLEGFFEETGASFPANVELTSVALRWATLETPSVMQALLRLDRAENYEQFRQALAGWTAPGLNVVYADVDGNIAYQVVGRLPLRARSEGEAPVPGWSSEFEWKGYVPFDELPRSLNPAKGYIVTANNPSAGSAYPYLITTEFDYGYRARRIVEMIESHPAPFTVKDIEAMQGDVLNFEALEVCAALQGLDLHPTALERHVADVERKDMSERQRARFDKKQNEELARMEKARTMLVGWDGRMSGESAAAALYGYVWEQLVAEIFRDQYPESEWPMSTGTRAENAVHYLLKDPANRLWDDVTTPVRETRDEILVRAFRRGFEALEKKAGTNPKKWRWDKIHTITFVNPTLGKSGIKPIETIFNRGPYPLPSGTSEVFAAAWDPKTPFETKHIPSMRLIVDMADVASALSIHPPGQSGHPGSRHYADFIDMWRKVQYHPVLWDKAAVEKHSEGTLVLVPR